MTYSEIFQPLIDLFTQSQVQTILLAWLPTKLESYLSGIMAVDMFLTSVLASGISALVLALFTLSGSIIKEGSLRTRNNITAQVESYIAGTYGYLYPNPLYEALSWIISQQTKSLNTGSFIVQPTNSMSNNKIDDCAPPNFNVLPGNNQQISIKFKGKNFNGSNTNVNAISEFLNEVTRAHKEHQRKLKERSRFERTETYWDCVQTLPYNKGLDTVALDEPYEILIRKELETFVNDKSFYERIGMPYRRGILLYGKPGTGKTSLINAVSSQLSRDIYYLNLKNIKNDNELSSAFSEIPPNKIIVLEDVDTQSKVLHKRTGNWFPSDSINTSDIKDKKDEGIGPKLDHGSKFSLSTFLGFLDGHILSEGNIIIMTTNHVEHLDPACIRPGRMDLHLDLDYCTHYQIKKMYKCVVESPKAEFPQEILEKIPEKLLPPCEVMMTMVLYRNEIDLIPLKVFELVTKYINMKPEDIAKKMEEEAIRLEDEANHLEEASVNLEESGEEATKETNNSDDDDSESTEVDSDYKMKNFENFFAVAS
ncbi:7389_t:CDS:2 [Funneliformis geosporum]|uniref:7389_t:CDS:1 n=1 Tax=Funneliformis geosporum TaxID=1117311 RepID=A0A9W4SFZ0_9GLOM|nr:7389_t:CDS:2 [Funneliformis geosporum]